MSALQLKHMASSARILHADLADAAGISRPALSALINHNVLPGRYDRADVSTRITTFLRDRGVANADAWQKPEGTKQDQTEETETMLLRKVNLTPQARRHFGVAGDPFSECQSAEEVFLSPDIRYVRESMFQVARNGGFLAVVGESGGGKTTLREELIDRIEREAQAVTVIQPYVLMTEDKDGVGKPLRSAHIAEAVMACVDPMAKTKNSPEARARQMHDALRQSSRSGHKHVLIIEEAHSLPIITLKHLKRFMELKDGLRPLLSIILVAQPELMTKLSSQTPEIREVMQRLEIIRLPALGTNLEEYVRHRFKHVGLPLEKVLDKGALDALRARLTPSAKEAALLYPLAIGNALASAMNRAADLGVPLVNGDLVRSV